MFVMMKIKIFGHSKMQPTKNTLLQAASSQPTNQSLQESIFSPTHVKLKNKKFPSLQKIKLHSTAPCKLDTSTLRTDNRASGNKGLAKVAVQWLIEHLCFVSSVGLADILVLRNRHLRQAPDRCMQSYRTQLPITGAAMQQ